MLRQSLASGGTPLKDPSRRRGRYQPLAAIGILTLAGVLTIAPAEAGGLFGFGSTDFLERGTFNWSGLYFGGHVGGASGDIDWNVQEPFLADFDDLDDALSACDRSGGGSGNSNRNGDRCRFSEEVDGTFAGAQLGFNQQISRFVIGFEGSISGGDLDGSSRTIVDIQDNDPVDPQGGTDRHHIVLDTEVDWFALATLRLGYTFDRVLLYLKGGYATGDIETRGQQHVFEVESGVEELEKSSHFDSSEQHHGYHIGAGIEYAFPTSACCNNLIFGLEYNYIDLDSEKHFGTAAEFDEDGEEVERRRFHMNVDPDGIHSVRFRLSYKFGCCEAQAALPLPPLK